MEHQGRACCHSGRIQKITHEPRTLIPDHCNTAYFLGGCGENVVEDDEIEYREGVAYLKGSNRSYTGKIIGLNSRGEKRSESQLEKGKMISWIGWHDNGKKAGEENYQNR